MFTRSFILLICCNFLLLTLSACQTQTASDVDLSPVQKTPIAQIDTHTIYEEDIDAEIHALPGHLQQRIDNPETRKQILQTLIRRYVLSQYATDLGLDNDPAIHHRIQQSKDSIMIDALRTWQLAHTPLPSKTEIQSYYQQHLADFGTLEQVHARHILVRDKKEALAIYDQLIKKKADFADLAIRYSIDDSNKSRGGDLNWFPRGVMVPAFEKAVFSLPKAGSISRPVQTQYGWHIIELLDKRAASQPSLSEVHDEVVQILRQKKLDTWMDELVKKNKPKILNTDNAEPALHY